MSILCIDIGNFAAVGAVPRDRGIDVITSTAGSKQIPSNVSINSNRRYFADDASSQRVTNRAYCYHCLPFLLGEKYDSPAVRRIRELGFDFNLKENPETHDAYAAVYFGGEQRIFSTASLVTSIAAEMRHFATNGGEYDEPTEVCVAVPGNWSAYKCHHMRAAVEGAGMKCNGLIPQHTAVGVGYYMKRVREFQPTDPKVEKIKNTIVFLSVGQLSSYLSVQTMSSEGISVDSAYYDPHLGAAEFDYTLYTLVVEEVLKKYPGKFTREELTSGKARAKLIKACNAAKKILSTNNRAPINVDCVGEQQLDISLIISIEDFNNACAPIVARFKDLILRGLSGTPAEKCENIDFVEIIGGASRVQCLRGMAESIFCADGHTERITRRLNADEATAIGLGWIAALRSTRHKVPVNVPVIDGIACLSDKLCCELRNTETNEYITPPGKIAIYENGMSFPSARKTTLRVQPCKRYELILREGENGLIHERVEFEITPNHNLEIAANCTEEQMRKAGVERDDENVSIKIKFHCDIDGAFRVASIKRTDAAIEWVTRKVRLPNPEYTMLVEKEQEKKEQEQVNNENQTEENSLKEGEQAAEVKTDIPREIEEEEKLPKIISGISNVEFKISESVQDTRTTAATLAEFERACATIDARAEEYDTLANKLEELIYATRNKIENKIYTDYADPETLTKLQDYIEECIGFVYDLSGVEQLPEVKERYNKLLSLIKEIEDRYKSFELAQSKLESLVNKTQILLNKRYPQDVLSEPDVPAGRQEVEGKAEIRANYRQKLNATCDEMNKLISTASRLEMAPIAALDKALALFDEAEMAMKPELKPVEKKPEPVPAETEKTAPEVVADETEEKLDTENENENAAEDKPTEVQNNSEEPAEINQNENENENVTSEEPAKEEENDPHGAANLD